MFNRVVLVGRLAADPELRYTPDGKAVATFRLAVNRPKREDGTQDADFIPVVVFRGKAEAVAEYCRKGRLLLIEGRLQQRRYETQAGEKRTTYEVVADQVRFFPDGRQREEQDGQEPETAPFDITDDLPF